MPADPKDGRDPYAEGREAADCGNSFDVNPYNPESEEAAHGLWHDGWNDATFGEGEFEEDA